MVKPSASNNLAVQYPELAMQWHPTKNGAMRPDEFGGKSNKPAWWQCPINPAHEWSAVIASRHSSNCPHCHIEATYKELISDGQSGKRLKLLRDDAELFSELVATEAERAEFGKLYVGDTRRLTWRCPDCKQTWPNQLRKRAIEKQGCTYCSGQTTLHHNSLLALHPDIAAQWDHEQNKLDAKLMKGPGLVSPGTHDKAWWKCEFGHAWKTEVRQRVMQRTGCPKCNPKTSRIEVRLACELEAALGVALTCGEKLSGWEADIEIPDLRVVIELDGYPWHSPDKFPDSLARDQKKTAHFKSLGYEVIRVREERLPGIEGCEIVTFCDGEEFLSACKQVLRVLAGVARLNAVSQQRVLTYQARTEFQAEAEYKERASKMQLPGEGKSLAGQFPLLIKQWCHEENLPLTPEAVLPGAHIKVWWRCEKGHLWDATINSRTKLGTGCRYCSGRAASPGNSLKDSKEFTAVASQWDYELNTTTPDNVTPKSNQKYWWHCDKGHHWEATVNNRTRGGQGCPLCAHKRASSEWNLLVNYPELAQFFDADKNKITADKVMPNAGKLFWWKCESGHEWEAQGDTQARYGARCRQCQSGSSKTHS